MKLALPAFPRFGKTTIVLGFALAIGVIAALAANRFLAGRIEAIEARNRGTTVEVVVARQRMKKGQVVDADNVALRAVPTSFAHSNALTQESFGRVAGRTLAYDIQAGEMLLASLLQASRPPTFSARVDAGRRAMTIAVDEINSISGLLDPGDMIDLIVGLERRGKKTTLPLLQGVQVMATGQRVVDDPLTGERRQYATVTLNLTPSQAVALVDAREGGRFTALLRNPEDKQDASGDTVDLAALLGQDRAEESEVPVLYGGNSGKFTPDALHLDGARGAMSRPMVPAMATAAGADTTRNAGIKFDATGAVPLVRSGASAPPPSASRTTRPGGTR
nr:Flp pilus assembly protein CpaB [uncultured Noviherbaspirillum sp.]